MESIYTNLALCGNKNECAKTDNVYFPISEVSDGMVSLLSRIRNGFWVNGELNCFGVGQSISPIIDICQEDLYILTDPV